MMKKRENLGIEIIVILSVFIVSILVLSKTFVSARVRSLSAARLSDAVTLASNVADVYLSSEDETKILEIFKDAGPDQGNDTLSFSFDEDLKPAENGSFIAQIKTSKEGDFETADIFILYQGEKIYSIKTGKEVRQ